MERCKKFTMTHNSISGHDTNPRIQCSKEYGHKGGHIFYMISYITNEKVIYHYKLPKSFC